MLKWNVYVEDVNRRQFVPYNVFDHSSFLEDCMKVYKKHKDDFDTFSTEIKRWLMYYFWAKCEWEIVVSAWPPNRSGELEWQTRDEKVDVYDQIMLNWDRFIEYVWENRSLLKKKR